MVAPCFSRPPLDMDTASDFMWTSTGRFDLSQGSVFQQKVLNLLCIDNGILIIIMILFI